MPNPVVTPVPADPSEPLLQVTDLQVYFGPPRRPVRAVDGVSLTVGAGECVGLVGESGCGKSTLGRAILRLEPIRAGQVRFAGQAVERLRGRALFAFRRRAQMIFQDPFGSLNPRMSAGRVLAEVLKVHGLRGRAARQARAEELFRAVGLDPQYLSRYPHEFSGGQRQRIGIARALAVGPELLIADEAVSALDVSVQVQILNLLRELQREWRLAYLFIAHDLAVVRYLCHRLYVMYVGRVVEAGPAAALYACPAHPYTRALLAAVPDVDRSLRGQPPAVLGGDVPSPAQRFAGCPFHPRCPMAQARCRVEVPALRELPGGRQSACHFAQDLLATGGGA